MLKHQKPEFLSKLCNLQKAKGLKHKISFTMIAFTTNNKLWPVWNFDLVSRAVVNQPIDCGQNGLFGPSWCGVVA
jgi:hypothetical protein